MKQISCKAPFEMQIEEIQHSLKPMHGEVLVKIKRIGICGTDLHAYSGNQPFFEYPRTLGHEASGVIEQIGEGVTTLQIGDHVTFIPYVHCGECVSCQNGKTNCCQSMKVMGVHIDGGMCECFVVPASHIIVTNGLSFEEAAMIEPLCIGAHAVRRAQIEKSDTVLVIGAGPIGLGVAKFAKLQQAKKVVLLDIAAERLQFAKEWSDADSTIQLNEQVQHQIQQQFDGHLPTVVFDATGNKKSMESAYNYISHGGKLIYVGLVKDKITFDDPSFHSKELTLFASRNATKEDFEYVYQCFKNDQIKEGYVTKYISFEDVPAYFEAKNYQSNKAMIVFE